MDELHEGQRGRTAFHIHAFLCFLVLNRLQPVAAENEQNDCSTRQRQVRKCCIYIYVAVPAIEKYQEAVM